MEAVHLKLQCFVCYLPCVRGNGGVTESPDNGFLVLELFQVIFLGSTFFFVFLKKKKKKNLSRQETAFFSLCSPRCKTVFMGVTVHPGVCSGRQVGRRVCVQGKKSFGVLLQNSLRRARNVGHCDWTNTATPWV